VEPKDEEPEESVKPNDVMAGFFSQIAKMEAEEAQVNQKS
jgi:hypothetical protein